MHPKEPILITICTDDKTHYFGKIKSGKMEFTNIGAIADVLLHDLKTRNKNYTLGEFVVMPNHLH